MKLKELIVSFTLILSTQSFADTATYVYCGLPDGSDWRWLLDENNNYVTIEGQWGIRIDTTGNYFNVFSVQESVFNEKALGCPEGYITQPAEKNSSYWEVFEIIRLGNPSYLIDGYKSYFNKDALQESSLLHFQRL